jgi:POT family proton-dependent oligopeptide transporter
VRLEGAAYFWMFAGLMLAAALVFRAVAARYRGAPAEPEPAR